MRPDRARGVVEAMMRVYILCALLSGCTTPGIYPSREAVYWDKPTTVWNWVADGIEPAAIIKAVGGSGAKVDGSVANHGVVPPGFSVHVFHFTGKNSAGVQECTLERLRAIPQLTTYLQ